MSETESKESEHAIHKANRQTPAWAYICLVLMAAVTYVTVPSPFQPHGEPTLNHVFFYGWLTALSTGLGVLPFLFLPDVASYWVGISNGTRDSDQRELLWF